jgi:hypothetical protein
MTSIASRNSALAIKVETTEGTPVSPTAASDYVALQDDFSMEPSFDVLENAEIRASIGSAKPILGAENPSASLSHYLRHSGTEGQAPNYKMLLKAAFGSEVVESTQYDTVAGSTTSVLNVDTGEGAQFERGHPLLIKDATNGYRIRPVYSVSSDALTLGFNVPTAPASGVNLGKAVFYKPANTGHQTLSLWHYLGNSGAIQMTAGARVTELGIDIAAGQLINASFSLEGLEYFFNPIEITSSTRYIDWEDDDGTFAATVATGFYKDPHALATAIQTAMNDSASTEVYTVTYLDASGKFKIVGTGTLLTLEWNTGANTANSIASKIGFSTAADSSGTGATTGYTGGSAITLSAPQTPSFDDSDPLAAKANEVMIGDADDYTCFEASAVNFSLQNDRQVIESVCQTSGRSGSVISGRSVTVSVTALLNQYDADKFSRFRQGTESRLQYSFGVKEGGNWVAGKCGAIFLPSMTITSFSITDNNGLATLEMECTAFVDSDGNGEAYLGFV